MSSTFLLLLWNQAASPHVFGADSPEEVWSDFDTNGDGYITADELVAKLGCTLKEAQDDIEAADEDPKDGKINPREAANAMIMIEAHIHER